MRQEQGEALPRIKSRNPLQQSPNLVHVDGKDWDSYSIPTLRLSLVSILTVKLRGPNYCHIPGPP